MKILAYIRTIRIYVLILGGLSLSYGVYQKYWYSDLIGEAVEAIEANRLDQQYLDKAKESFFAQKDLISYNMGVRAYRSHNLKKASEYFYDVIRKSDDSSRKMLAYYNLGNILVTLDLPKKAAEMYRESLRIDPDDWDSKYNLERLYVFYPMAFPSDKKQASLDQEPGANKQNESQMGHTGGDQSDI